MQILDQIWPSIGIFGHFGPGHAGSFGALLVGWLVVVARWLYLARHLFTLYLINLKKWKDLFIRSACLKTNLLHRSLLLRNSKESQNLCLPAGFSKHPVLVCDFNDRSLYILCGAEKECAAWKIHLQEVGDGDDNGAMMMMMMIIC